MREYAEGLYAELVLPELTRAVNSAPEYAELRLAYYWRLVWEWARERGAAGALIGAAVPLGDPVRVEGWSTEGLFDDYLASVGEGEFHIKREVSVGSVRLLRTYYHGGVDFRHVPTMSSAAVG